MLCGMPKKKKKNKTNNKNQTVYQTRCLQKLSATKTAWTTIYLGVTTVETFENVNILLRLFFVFSCFFSQRRR